MNGSPVITTRQITENDLPLIMEWRMRPDITKYMNTDPVLTLEGQKKWLEKISNDKTCKYWMVEIDGEPSGVVNLADIDYEKKTTSWGYYIANLKKRSIAVALNLESALYDYCFFELELKEVHNETFAENKGVLQLHSLLGCSVEHVAEKEVFKNNTCFDVVHMLIKREEWLGHMNCGKNKEIFLIKGDE